MAWYALVRVRGQLGRRVAGHGVGGKRPAEGVVDGAADAVVGEPGVGGCANWGGRRRRG